MKYGQRFITLYRREGSRLSPRKRNEKRQNGCLRRPLQIAEERKVKGKGEKERYIHLNAEFQRIARRDKKVFLSGQCKKAKWLSEEALQIAVKRREGKT